MRSRSFRASALFSVVTAIAATLISTSSFASTSSNCAECNSAAARNQILSTPGANNQAVMEFSLESLMGPAQGVSNASVMFDDGMANAPLLPQQNNWTPGNPVPETFFMADYSSEFSIPLGYWDAPTSGFWSPPSFNYKQL